MQGSVCESCGFDYFSTTFVFLYPFATAIYEEFITKTLSAYGHVNNELYDLKKELGYCSMFLNSKKKELRVQKLNRRERRRADDEMELLQAKIDGLKTRILEVSGRK